MPTAQGSLPDSARKAASYHLLVSVLCGWGMRLSSSHLLSSTRRLEGISILPLHGCNIAGTFVVSGPQHPSVVRSARMRSANTSLSCGGSSRSVTFFLKVLSTEGSPLTLCRWRHDWVANGMRGDLRRSTDPVSVEARLAGYTA